MAEPAFKQALDMMRLGDLDGASKIAEAEIQRVENGGVSAGIWHYRLIRAKILGSRGRVEEALRYLESFASPGPLDLESSAGLKMYRGYFSGYLGRYEPAHRLLGDAEAIAREANLLSLQGDVFLSRAFIFFRQKDYVSSDLMYRSLLGVADKTGDWYFRGHALWGIGKNLMIQERHSDAMPWLNESLAIFGGVGAQLSVAMVFSELAVCHLGLGDDERAMRLLRDAERMNRDAGAIHNYQVVLANIGNVYLYRRDHFTAISYYQRALALAREIGDPVSTKKWTRNINLAYARIRQSVDERSPRIA